MTEDKQYQWCVVGAGPAGIAVIGQLVDRGVHPEQIVWIDPAFQVGDFGTLWRNVGSNTKVKFFLQFLHDCHCFQAIDILSQYELFQLNPEETCKLHQMADPLQAISNRLAGQVVAMRDKVVSMQQVHRHWQLTLQNDSVIESNKVVLAIGAEPKILDGYKLPMIDLRDALDLDRLRQRVTSQDVVAVFGSSHSAIMILRDLLTCGVQHVVNFYQSSLRFAVEMDDWILFDNTGLKGKTAEWAREHLEGDYPPNLTRYQVDEVDIASRITECNKAIYAVGFAPRSLPVGGLDVTQFNNKTGIIAPGLFGAGIAYPELKVDPVGNAEHSVGLWKFMTYFKRVIPIWQQYD